jgi:hypothetical protein
MARIKGAVTPRKVNAGFADVAAGPVLPTFTLAQLPSAASNTGRIVRCSNGNAGAACLAVSNGTSWLRVVFGAAVATS